MFNTIMLMQKITKIYLGHKKSKKKSHKKKKRKIKEEDSSEEEWIEVTRHRQKRTLDDLRNDNRYCDNWQSSLKQEQKSRKDHSHGSRRYESEKRKIKNEETLSDEHSVYEAAPKHSQKDERKSSRKKFARDEKERVRSDYMTTHERKRKNYDSDSSEEDISSHSSTSSSSSSEDDYKHFKRKKQR